MPTSQPVPAGTTSVLFTSSGVSAFLDLVDDVDDQFDQQLDSDPPTYIYEWSRFLNQARRDLKKKGASFKDTSKRLFSNPNSWHDYVAAVLEMVPPVNPVLKIQKQDTVTRNVTIIRYEITNDILLEQMEQYVKWAPLEDDNSKVSDHDSIPSSLSKQLREQSQFEASMSDFKSDMEEQIRKHMEDLTALLTKNSLIDPEPKIKEAKDVLKTVDTDATKLLGNIKKCETQVNDLRKTTDSLP